MTDASPYALKTAGLGEISRAITEMEPTKPSDAVQRELNENPIEGNKDRLIRRLRGDLDAILLKALRKEPQLRYGSVEQLSEDIHRHLAGLPVHARKGTQSYRAWKFVRRHRVGVLASALSAGAIVAGGGVALHEARVAEMNRQRADRRFNDVRKLANSLIFEIHDSIRQLPGATGARKLLIDRAQGYLDSLANESQSDLSLQRELAGAYGRLAGVQGDSLDANLGNSAQALSNYRKATELLSKCLAMDPKNVEVQKELGSSYVDLSMALLRTGDKNGSKEYINKAVQFLETASSQYPNDRQLKATLGRAYERSGTVLAEVNDLNGALSQYQKSLTVLLMASDGSPVSQSAIGFAHKHIGSVLAVQNKLDDALHHYKEALAIDEALLARDPLNGQAKYAVTFSYSDTGWILDKMGDSSAALQYYAKAMRIRQALAEADPQDVRARRGLGNTYNYIGNIHRERKEYAESLDSLRKALAIREALVVKDPSNQGYPFDVAETQANLGFTYLAQASVAASAQRAKLRQSAALYMGKALPVYEERKKQGRLKGTEVATVADLERELGKLAASQNLK
jgi:non-specific serine/threonine protein kinase/serine/threonine-protein kinase